MKKITLDEWFEIAGKALRSSWFPPNTSEATARAVGSSMLASFCCELFRSGYSIRKEEDEDV